MLVSVYNGDYTNFVLFYSLVVADCFGMKTPNAVYFTDKNAKFSTIPITIKSFIAGNTKLMVKLSFTAKYKE